MPDPDRSLDLLVAMAIRFPEVLESDAELFARLEIPDPQLDRVRRAILEAHDSTPRLDREGVRLHLNAAGFGGIVPRLLGSSIFKGLGFVRGDDVVVAKENWRLMLLELHKRGAQEELRRAGEVGDEELTEHWQTRVDEMRRDLARTRALELDDEAPIIDLSARRPGGRRR
jgi:DNA primase